MKRINFLFKDVKEYNKYLLSILGIFIILLAGIISYNYTNSSYAKWSSGNTSSNTLKVSVNVPDTSGANAPELTSNMIPVYYDETNDVWRKADSSNSGSNWYNYDKKKWANVVTVANESYCSNADYKTQSECENATVGSCNISSKKTQSECEKGTFTFNGSCLINGSTVQMPNITVCLNQGGTPQGTTSESGVWTESNADYIWNVVQNDRNYYLNAPEGTEIPMDDINTMWVWIPRYTYTYLNTNTPQEISIKFESGTNSSETITCTDAIGQTDSDGNSISQTCTDTTNGSLTAGTSTYTHPAFTFGDEELTGIWVGKFENSATTIPTSESTADSTIIIKPNENSLRYKAVSYLFKDVRQMEAANNVYGFEQSSSTSFNWNGALTGDTNNIDTHMMKNIEWGAVTYLYHSKYGRCTDGTCEEITINNCSNLVTGIGADTVSADSSATTCTTDKNKYNGESGVKASTTGNVYGVYDMSGGAYEYVMGNMVDSSNQFYTSYAANWSTTTYPLAKYYDSYTYNTSDTTYTRGRLGDAIIEMAPGSEYSWYSDYASFSYSIFPYFIRGDNFNNGSDVGSFSFAARFGGGSSTFSARASLVVLN